MSLEMPGEFALSAVGPFLKGKGDNLNTVTAGGE